MSGGLIKNCEKEMPCLGALGRCASCIQAAAAVDRQSRIAAETRLLAREKSAQEAAGWLKLESGRLQATVGAPHG